MSRRKGTWEVANHRARRVALQTARLAAWWWAPHRWPERQPYSPAQHGELDVLVGEVSAPLTRAEAFADAALEEGKRKNLGLAVRAFDRVMVAPDRPLSFWRTLGPASASRGYTWGREVRGGCIVPAIAGGLCLLSNALFELAVRAGWHVLERHAHSLEAVPPIPGTLPLDATVAFPDVDLVIAPLTGLARLEVRTTAEALEVRAFMAAPLTERIELTFDQRVEQRGAERIRASTVTRRRVDASGAVLSTEFVTNDARRILAADELHRTCISCDEHDCRDRPSETVLISLRRSAR